MMVHNVKYGWKRLVMVELVVKNHGSVGAWLRSDGWLRVSVVNSQYTFSCQ